MTLHVGMIGLGTMGANLARNIESNGYSIAVYNRTTSVTEKFMTEFGEGNFHSSATLEELVESLSRPRQIILLVKAGAATDAVIDQLLPLLEADDIIIDGGNSYFTDTIRREKACGDQKVLFLGLGVSGGEEGALKGPSLMPGGPLKAWEILEPMLKKIAADVDGPCVSYLGGDGAGHFVKMVHNGIEYGDMQLIAEAYDILKLVGGFKAQELAAIFSEWNKGPLESYLIEITAKIFELKDEDRETFLIDQILDKAAQKGTGKWTAQVALDLGAAVPTISAAVNARIVSSLKSERLHAAKNFQTAGCVAPEMDREALVTLVHDALYCSKIMSYAQGMSMLSLASKEYGWELRLESIAALWKGGCIIRARFLNDIEDAFSADPSLKNLMLDPKLAKELSSRIKALREALALAVGHAVPVMAFANSLAYYDSYHRESLPQNLTQAQRDFFGAHTYERLDREGVFHTEWE